MAAPQEHCGNCKFYLTVASHTWRTDQLDRGLCRYNPPKAVDNRIDLAADDNRWPLCMATEWCGKWVRA